MSAGLVRILLCLSVKESSGDGSEFLKPSQLIFLGLISYSWRYLEMAFLTHVLVYLLVIAQACLLAVRMILESCYPLVNWLMNGRWDGYLGIRMEL
jgi:hypothetical protein